MIAAIVAGTGLLVLTGGLWLATRLVPPADPRHCAECGRQLEEQEAGWCMTCWSARQW